MPLVPQCHFCTAAAAALLDMPEGCLCSARRYQYRCVQHILRAHDSEEIYTVVATFPDYTIVAAEL